MKTTPSTNLFTRKVASVTGSSCGIGAAIAKRLARVQPDPIDTDMNPSDGDFAAMRKAGTALGPDGQPEEIAAAVAFLAGPDADFITGATLDVDGGTNA